MKYISLIMAVLLLVSSLSGCEAAPASSSKTMSSSAADATLAATSELIIAANGAITPTHSTIDPIFEDSGISSILSLMFDGLMRYDIASDGATTLATSLAESYTISDDGLVYTFKLRGGTKFYDASAVTADDWVFSIERLKANTSGPWSAYAQIIREVAKVDDNSITIKLSHPNAEFLTLLTLPCFAVQSKKHADALAENYQYNTMGTGSFYMYDYDINEFFTLKRNPNYRKPITSNVDTVTFKIINDDALRVSQLKDGKIDVCIEPARANLADILAHGGLAVHKTPSIEQRLINLDVTKAPLNDARVRRALRMATDKAEIVEMLLFDSACPAENIFSKSSLYYNSQIDYDSFDIDMAKALLTEAGYPDGFAIELSYVEGLPIAEGVGALLTEQWAKVGVKLKLDPLKQDDLNEKFNNLVYDMTTLRWENDTLDPAGLANFIAVYDNSQGFNTGYKNATVTELERQARLATTDDTRRAALFELQKILYDDCPLFPLFELEYVAAMKDNIAGFNRNPLGEYDFDELNVLLQ